LLQSFSVTRRHLWKCRMIVLIAMLSLMGTLLVSPSPSLEASSNLTELSSENLALVGDAELLNSGLRLNSTEANLYGAAWTTVKPSVADGFETTFDFRISKPGGANHPETFNDGADGLAFVIQNSEAAAIGGNQGGIGYSGIPNSLAIEIDTWWNVLHHGDPNGNHISVQTQGTEPNSVHHRYSLRTFTFIPKLTDFQVHTLKIVYSPGRMSVFLDDFDEKLFSVRVNLNELLNLDQGAAWIGFTASTGAAWENHDIVSWSFSSN